MLWVVVCATLSSGSPCGVLGVSLNHIHSIARYHTVHKRCCATTSIGIARPKVERTDVSRMLIRIRTAPLTTFAPLGRVSAVLRMITPDEQSERSERDSESSDPYGGIENHSHLVIDFRHFCHFLGDPSLVSLARRHLCGTQLLLPFKYGK